MLPLAEFFRAVERICEVVDDDLPPDALAVTVVISLATFEITADTPVYERDLLRTARWLVARSRRVAAQIEASKGSLWHTIAHVLDATMN